MFCQFLYPGLVARRPLGTRVVENACKQDGRGLDEAEDVRVECPRLHPIRDSDERQNLPRGMQTAFKVRERRERREAPERHVERGTQRALHGGAAAVVRQPETQEVQTLKVVCDGPERPGHHVPRLAPPLFEDRGEDGDGGQERGSGERLLRVRRAQEAGHFALDAGELAALQEEFSRVGLRGWQLYGQVAVDDRRGLADAQREALVEDEGGPEDVPADLDLGGRETLSRVVSVQAEVAADAGDDAE